MAPKKKPTKRKGQLPSHVGLFHKLKNRTDKTNEALKILRGR